MSKLSGLLEEATFNSVRQTFCIDGKSRAQRDHLQQELRQAIKLAEQKDSNERLGKKSPAAGRVEAIHAELQALESAIADRLITIEFTAVSSEVWSRLKLRYPVAKDASPLDRQQGYNTEAVTKAVVVDCGRLVDGDELEKIDAGEWEKLYAAITGGDFDRLRLTIIQLNSVDGFQGVDYLKAASSETPNSDAKSE